MGNNVFGDNFEGGHTFANSKQEVRTPLSKLIWGTMNTKVLISLIVPMPQKLARAAKGWPTQIGARHNGSNGADEVQRLALSSPLKKKR